MWPQRSVFMLLRGFFGAYGKHRGHPREIAEEDPALFAFDSRGAVRDSTGLGADRGVEASRAAEACSARLNRTPDREPLQSFRTACLTARPPSRGGTGSGARGDWRGARRDVFVARPSAAHESPTVPRAVCTRCDRWRVEGGGGVDLHAPSVARGADTSKRSAANKRHEGAGAKRTSRCAPGARGAACRGWHPLTRQAGRRRW